MIAIRGGGSESMLMLVCSLKGHQLISEGVHLPIRMIECCGAI